MELMLTKVEIVNCVIDRLLALSPQICSKKSYTQHFALMCKMTKLSSVVVKTTMHHACMYRNYGLAILTNPLALFHFYSKHK